MSLKVDWLEGSALISNGQFNVIQQFKRKLNDARDMKSRYHQTMLLVSLKLPPSNFWKIQNGHDFTFGSQKNKWINRPALGIPFVYQKCFHFIHLCLCVCWKWIYRCDLDAFNGILIYLRLVFIPSLFRHLYLRQRKKKRLYMCIYQRIFYFIWREKTNYNRRGRKQERWIFI